MPELRTRRRRSTGSKTTGRSPVLVTRATLRDLDAVTALRMALLREESGEPVFAQPHLDASRRALQLTRKQLTSPGQVVLLARRNDEAVGILRCREVRRTGLVRGARQAMVTTAYVSPAERRSGVLRELLAAADKWCRQRRLAGMRLHCGLANNIGRKAWESLGFGAAALVYLRTIPRD